MVFEENDLDLDGAGATREIVLPALPPAICKSQEIPGVSQTAMRMRLFLLSLTREATN
ncbi:hypothetical protein KY284_026400 [Solanum tuberosum]|nr:hypothetical protein KY284_026400 [Solanum tuberosum]